MDALDKDCRTCGHPIRHHDHPTPNRDLVTCRDCFGERLCLVHLGYQQNHTSVYLADELAPGDSVQVEVDGVTFGVTNGGGGTLHKVGITRDPS
jgi:hypothetical protein